MGIKKISFIEPSAPGLHIFSKFPIPRLGAVLLSTILRERGYDVKTFIEDLAAPDWSFIESSDIVCISTITSTAIRAYRMGKRVRALYIPVIMGGAHPTFLPDEAMDYADFVIRGEGENPLVELLEHMDKGFPNLEDIQGLSYRDREGKIVHNPAGDFLEDLDGLPTPDFSLVHNWAPSNTYPVATSRGCPYACTFCSVIGMFGRKYRCKSVEGTLAELKHAVSVSKAVKFIVDDNFAANITRTKQILRAMIAEKIRTRWSAQVRTEVGRDPELLRLMADSGCDTLFIGLESINPRTLEEYHKKQDLHDIVTCIKAVRDHGIHIHGMFVLGAETDDVKTIRDTVDFAQRLAIDTIQIMILTPLPGTPLFDEMTKRGRLLHTDWRQYDVQHVVYKPRLMSPATLQVETLKAMGRFYSWKYVFRHLARLDFHYMAVGLFGKRAVDRSLKAFTACMDHAASPSFGCEEVH